jgi:hypothetical protein
MSNLLEQASLVMIPSGYKEDVVYSEIPLDGSGDLSFTRASNGTRINSQGLVEDMPWNLFGYSEQFTDGSWGKLSGTTVTANQTTAPNGTLTADLITEGTSVLLYWGSLFKAGTYTQSYYAKKGTGDIVGMYFGSSFTASFNLTSGTIVSTNNTTATITNVGDGWYRITATATPTADFYAGLNYSNSSGLNIYLWGAQLNIGSTAKPYFPTTDRLNVPRLTYQNGGGGCPSLLLEKQSTNLVTYSQEFDNADWLKLQATISANATTSPDGTQNADKFVANTSNVIHSLTQTISSVSPSWTYSVFAKSAGYDRVILNVFNTNYVGFNLTTGVIESSLGTFVTSANIENYGNGWYRCSITSTSTSTGTNFAISVFNSAYTNGNTNPTFAGNGTDGIYLWGAQLEASSYPTSYIPTTSSSATRVVDICSKTGISSLIGQTEGVLFFDIETINTSNVKSISLVSSNFNNFMYYYESNNNYYFIIISNGASLTLPFANQTLPSRKKIALRYSENNFSMWVNGTKRVEDLGIFDTPIGLSGIQLLSPYNQTDTILDGKINSIQLYKTALTNAELQALTTL